LHHHISETAFHPQTQNFRRRMMFSKNLAFSALALGFLAPATAFADPAYDLCMKEQIKSGVNLNCIERSERDRDRPEIGVVNELPVGPSVPTAPAPASPTEVPGGLGADLN
jgi:hypothetical protein